MKHKYTPDTFCYRMLNNNNAVLNTLGKILKEDDIKVSPVQLELQLAEIKRNYKFPKKFDVLEAVENGQMMLVFSTQYKMPASLPFILMSGNNNSIVPIIFLDIYGTKNKETKNINIETKKLYALMEGAYLAAKYSNKTDVQMKTPLITNGCKMYSGLITRPLNKAYALNTDKNKQDSVIFLAAAFYLINALGMDIKSKENAILNYSMGACRNPNHIMLQNLYDEVLSKYPDTFKSLDTFIKTLANPDLRLNMKGLGERNYLESCISMYGSTILMALETFEYFSFNVLSARMGAYINNEYAINSIIENDAGSFYNALVDII